MMTSITAQDLAATDRKLTASHQVRFTAPQDRLIRQLAAGSRRPISATIRDIVVCWAANVVNAEADLTDDERPIDLHRLLEELRALAELEAREQ